MAKMVSRWCEAGPKLNDFAKVAEDGTFLIRMLIGNHGNLVLASLGFHLVQFSSGC